MSHQVWPAPPVQTPWGTKGQSVHTPGGPSVDSLRRRLPGPGIGPDQGPLELDLELELLLDLLDLQGVEALTAGGALLELSNLTELLLPPLHHLILLLASLRRGGERGGRRITLRVQVLDLRGLPVRLARLLPLRLSRLEGRQPVGAGLLLCLGGRP